MNKEIYKRLKDEARIFMEEYNQEDDVLKGIEKKINLKEAINLLSNNDIIESIREEVLENE